MENEEEEEGAEEGGGMMRKKEKEKGERKFRDRGNFDVPREGEHQEWRNVDDDAY